MIIASPPREVTIGPTPTRIEHQTTHAFETAEFRAGFEELLAWRRDVRSFRADPVPEELIGNLLSAAAMAPSVGFSQPSRFVRVAGDKARKGVQESFHRCNADALAGYDGADARLYAQLKLAGLDEAPLQLAVFSDRATAAGRGLGRHTMPETLDYSVIAAVQILWLVARTYGLGLGWVSILDPLEVTELLNVTADWRLIAYLCLGYPRENCAVPELQRQGWQNRTIDPSMLIVR